MRRGPLAAQSSQLASPATLVTGAAHPGASEEEEEEGEEEEEEEEEESAGGEAAACEKHTRWTRQPHGRASH